MPTYKWNYDQCDGCRLLLCEGNIGCDVFVVLFGLEGLHWAAGSEGRELFEGGGWDQIIG